MKILVVYYSRTGNTRKVAEEIENTLNCDIEEIIDTKNRSGLLNYITSGFQASRKKLTTLENIKNDPAIMIYSLLAHQYGQAMYPHQSELTSIKIKRNLIM